MPNLTFPVSDQTHPGYIALPATGTGPGILVLHAWWGLNDTFRGVCDRLAQNGFVAFAPGFYNGEVATTIAGAQEIQGKYEGSNPQAMLTVANAALGFLRAHPAVRGSKFGAIGFSMGTYYARYLDGAHPDTFAGIVLVYGESGADVTASHSQYQFHFADNDPYEDIETAKKLSAPNLELYIYPGTTHWFFEPDRPEYNPTAAELAWQRTLTFFSKYLPSPWQGES